MNEIFETVFVFLGIEAAGAAVEKTENQITFENFIVQAQDTKRFNPPIIKYTPLNILNGTTLCFLCKNIKIIILYTCKSDILSLFQL